MLMILLEFGFTLFLNELLSWLLRFSPTSFSPQNAKQLHVMQGRLFRLKASIVAIFPAIPNIPTTNTPIPNIKTAKHNEYHIKKTNMFNIFQMHYIHQLPSIQNLDACTI